MDIKECYEILGITKKATDEQIKKAWLCTSNTRKGEREDY